MSAGPTLAELTSAHVCNDANALAPAMRLRVENAIAECTASGLDAIVYETFRSQPLQHIYFEQGRRGIAGESIVTNVDDIYHGWHGFGLAVDVISRAHQWDVPSTWRAAVTEIFKRHGLDWAGDWPTFKDLPHYQFGGVKRSPSDEARALFTAGGLEAVWRAVGALEPTDPGAAS